MLESEKLTLSDVDKKAKRLYGDYRDAYWEEYRSRNRLETPVTAESLAEANPKPLFERKKTHQKRLGKAAASITAIYTSAAGEAERALDDNIARAKTFAHDNADQLQEVAHIQARMDGVETTTRHA